MATGYEDNKTDNEPPKSNNWVVKKIQLYAQSTKKSFYAQIYVNNESRGLITCKTEAEFQRIHKALTGVQRTQQEH